MQKGGAVEALRGKRIDKNVTVKSEHNGFAGVYLYGFFIAAEPNGYGGGVVYLVSVGAENQAVICHNVIVYINVYGVPDVVTSAHFFGKFFYYIPIVLIVKLIGMPPKVEKLRAAVAVIFKEAVAVLEKSGIFVVACRVEPQPVGRYLKAAGGFCGAGIGNTVKPQQFHHVITVCSERICHTSADRTEQLFNFFAFADYFLIGGTGGQFF